MFFGSLTLGWKNIYVGGPNRVFLSYHGPHYELQILFSNNVTCTLCLVKKMKHAELGLMKTNGAEMFEITFQTHLTCATYI